MLSSKNVIRRAGAILTARLSSNPVIINHLKTCQKYAQARSNQQIQHLTTSCRLLSPASFQCVNIQDSGDFNSKVLKSNIPVIVDFHAVWCGPCKILGPRLEAIVSEKKGKVILAKVDIDENSELALKYGVRSVPTVFSFKNGKVQDSFIGLKEDDLLKGFVDQLA